MIKDELQPAAAEYPGFVLSMNAEPQSFPDEVVKRSLMIYTTTALPAHDERLRQQLQGRIQEMRRGLTGHLYRRYLIEIIDQLNEDRLPADWLALSSGTLSRLISESTDSQAAFLVSNGNLARICREALRPGKGPTAQSSPRVCLRQERRRSDRWLDG